MPHTAQAFLLLLAADPDRAREFLDRLVDIHLANLEQYLAAVGPYIDIILFGDDLGMQRGPQISPTMYRDLFKPRHAQLWQRAKELADVKVMLHCCGGVRELLDDLIDAGRLPLTRNLRDDLTSRQIAQQAHAARFAERACARAADLRRHAQRTPAVAHR